MKGEGCGVWGVECRVRSVECGVQGVPKTFPAGRVFDVAFVLTNAALAGCYIYIDR